MRREIRLLIGGGIAVVLALLAVGGTAVGVDSPRAAFAVGSDFRISGTYATHDDWEPAVACNRIDNQCLVVWEDKRSHSTRHSDIYGRLLAGDGSLIGSEFRISGPAAVGGSWSPAVVWSDARNQYLVVWEDGRNLMTHKGDIYGQLLKADGSATGPNFQISGANATEGTWDPDVAWDQNTRRYLVVWSDSRNSSTRGEDIYGRRLNVGGDPAGGAFRISGPNATGDEEVPVVAWNGAANQYLVVWEDGRSSSTRGVDIFGRRLAADGSRLGGDVRISGPAATADDKSPAVVWNQTDNQYLVVWSDDRNDSTRDFDIFGQRLAGNGPLIGANFMISGPGSTSQDARPAVVWNATARNYLVIWEDWRYFATRGIDLFGVKLFANGSVLGTPFSVSSSGSTHHEMAPDMAWNPTANRYVIVWGYDTGDLNRFYDVWGKLLNG